MGANRDANLTDESTFHGFLPPDVIPNIRPRLEMTDGSARKPNVEAGSTAVSLVGVDKLRPMSIGLLCRFRFVFRRGPNSDVSQTGSS